MALPTTGDDLPPRVATIATHTHFSPTTQEIALFSQLSLIIARRGGGHCPPGRIVVSSCLSPLGHPRCSTLVRTSTCFCPTRNMLTIAFSHSPGTCATSASFRKLPRSSQTSNERCYKKNYDSSCLCRMQTAEDSLRWTTALWAVSRLPVSKAMLL